MTVNRQEEAITTCDVSLVVSAGAGTGKTYVLVNRYLHLLETFGAGVPSAGQVSVPNILALTFTDKAAAEMKERIRAALEGKEGPFWEKARVEFLAAPVQTFHSFCSGVLREYALIAGLDPSFTVLDEREASRILSRSFQDLIHTPVTGSAAGSLVRVLAVAGQFTLEKMLHYLYARREESERFFSRLAGDPTAIISCWQEEISRFRNEQVRRIREDPRFSRSVLALIGYAGHDVPATDKAMAWLQEVIPFLYGMRDETAPDPFLQIATSFLGVKSVGSSGSGKLWGEDTIKDLRADNKVLREVLRNAGRWAQLSFTPGDPFSDSSLRFLSDLGETFTLFCSIVDAEKASAGGMDFSDLIRHTRRLFRTRPDLVETAFRERYRFILIDEFQDTDPAQFEIVTAIIGDPSPAVKGLFIVGDPKQSIYLFRDADVTRFRQASDMITGPCRGKEIPLDVCFRSSPAVIALVNHLFSDLFAEAVHPWEFTYDRIRVSSERAGHTGSVSVILVDPEGTLTEPEAVADAIVKNISDGIPVYEEGPRDSSGLRTFTTRPAAYRDIAILLERRTKLGQYLHALAARNIPYYVHKGSGLYQRQEILDLISLLSVLYRPYDDLHLTGLLRSPYFGLSDCDLTNLTRYPGSTLYDRLSRAADDGPAFARVYALLSGWLAASGRKRLVPLIRSILDESGILAVYGGMTEGDQILSNIEKLLDLIRKREESRQYRLPDLVADLHDALDREEPEGEAMIDDPGHDAVTIMTIHAAKGLEFPIVYVPEMAHNPPSRPDPILMDGPRDLLGVRIPDPEDAYKTGPTPVYTILYEEGEEKRAAEKKRLLYVALTRAADHLIMSGTTATPLPDGAGSSRFDWILPALGIRDHTIRTGQVIIPGENGPSQEIAIICPEPDAAAVSQKIPPLVVDPSLAGVTGRFIRIPLPRGSRDGIPFLVTDLAGSIPCPGFAETRGEGAVFGSAVHEALRGKDPDLVIGEYGITDPGQGALIRSVFREFSSDPVISGMTGVERELAFTVVMDGIALTGRMDYIGLLPDGTWLVLDYKTGPVEVPGFGVHPAYRFQVEVYRRAAGILGMTPVNGALYGVLDRNIIDLPPWDDTTFLMMLHSLVDGQNRRE